jgi:hypothetical protein
MNSTMIATRPAPVHPIAATRHSSDLFYATWLRFSVAALSNCRMSEAKVLHIFIFFGANDEVRRLAGIRCGNARRFKWKRRA